MKNLVSQFLADESGAGAVEYALVLLLALSIVTIVAANLKPQISNLITSITAKINTNLALIS